MFQENRVHREIVGKGKAAVDEWRKSNPGAQLNLLGAHLAYVDLCGADLSGADLRFGRLENVDLTGANLSGANLSNTMHFNTVLKKADLSRARIVVARFLDCDLTRANLSGANLVHSDLSYGNLSQANLSGADLALCRLFHACLVGAELTGARLYGTARDDWKIERVKCRYVFWDEAGQERSPRDRDLEPGEFERLYAQLPTIEYIFENGMTPLDPLVMDRIVQGINQKTPEFELQIDSINSRGLQPTIKFTVRHEDQKATALEAITQGYKLEYAKLQGKYEELRELIYQMIDRPGSAPINIGSNSMVAIGGSTINIQEYINHLEEIEQAIKEAPEDTLSQSAKQAALDTVNGAVKDLAKSRVKEAAEAIVGLGVQLGPRIASTSAFQFFKDLLG